MYIITDYTKKKAKELGVVVKKSSDSKKKIDVFKNGEKIASVGAIGYKDFPTYLKEEGIKYANKKRRAYRIRHKKDLKSGNGFYAAELLW